MAASSAHTHQDHAAHNNHGSHHGGGHGEGGGFRTHSHAASYVKIWALLLVLLIVSIIGPEFGIRIVTLITAFGIAIVKAWIVCANFMHLKDEKRYVSYILYTMLLMMGLFFAGVMTDILKKDGWRWRNAASYKYIENYLANPEPGHKASSDQSGSSEATPEHK